MGVRGLTGYIARHAELYLLPYELHDCNLVIDGDSLSCNLYTDVAGVTSTFSGDYDVFYRAVVDFFQVLAECNIEPYVLMDGGYESRKLHTVGQRLRGKISVIKKVNPCATRTVFPLLMKEVFVDAVRDCGVSAMRCLYEADDELATLSRKLNCPVLTYDSDFYIYNVQYIPLVTLTIKAHTKRWEENQDATEDHLVGRTLRKCEAKHVEKLTKSARICGEIRVNNVEKGAPRKGKTYKFLDCCIYRIEHLIQQRSLSKEKLPLFAALLGNDYIARSRFRNLFAAGMGKIGRSRKVQRQQKRIRVILQWLKEQTVQSAMRQILSRLRKGQRRSLKAQMYAAINGYSNEKCHSYDFFVKKYENAFQRYPPPRLLKGDTNVADEDEEDFSIDSADGEIIMEAREEVGMEREGEDEEEDEDDYSTEASENGEESSANCEEGELGGNSTEADENEGQVVDKTKVLDYLENDEGDSEQGDESDDEKSGGDKTSRFPSWFLDKLYPAHLPRYFVNLIHLRKYINSPQIEHFPYADCNEIALPILIYAFTLLHKGMQCIEKPSPPTAEAQDIDQPENAIEFTYMARRPRVTNIHYTRYGMDEAVKDSFEPTQPNSQLFEHIFRQRMPQLDADRLFLKVRELPRDLQMYFIAIVYWLHKSQHCDVIHLHALLICVVVLRTVDAKILAERKERDFQKRFAKLLKKERAVRDAEALKGKPRMIRESLLALPVPERMSCIPKSDCYLVMEGLLKHFHMQEIFKKKFDDFSTIVLHSFTELQSIVFQLYGLNGLLDMPFEPTKMGSLYCGVFIYNVYDLLKIRADIRYYVRNFIFRDSLMMYDFYEYLLNWCDEFVPPWKRPATKGQVRQAPNKKTLKKKRQAARRKATAKAENIDPNAEFVDHSNGKEGSAGEEAEEFMDVNNKFYAFLTIK